MPDRDPAIAEEGRDVLGAAPGVREGERRDPALHGGQPVEPALVGQPSEEALAELPLPRLDRIEPERAEVVDGRDEPGQELVRQRSRLVAVPERLARRRADLVRPPALQQLGPAEREP